jgi:hypothetical protein
MFHCFSHCGGPEASLALAGDMGSSSPPVSMKGENIVLKAVSQSLEDRVPQKLMHPQQRVKMRVAEPSTCPSDPIRIGKEER